MKKPELVEILEGVSRVILLNKELATPERIEDLKGLVTYLESQEAKDFIKCIFGEDKLSKVQDIVDAIWKFISIEEELQTNGLQDRLFENIMKIKNSNLILATICTLI